MHPKVTEWVRDSLNYTQQRLSELDAMLPRDSKEREIVSGLQSVVGASRELIQQEQEREAVLRECRQQKT